jgi:hypothetical protein
MKTTSEYHQALADSWMKDFEPWRVALTAKWEALLTNWAMGLLPLLRVSKTPQ